MLGRTKKLATCASFTNCMLLSAWLCLDLVFFCLGTLRIELFTGRVMSWNCFQFIKCLRSIYCVRWSVALTLFWCSHCDPYIWTTEWCAVSVVARSLAFVYGFSSGVLFAICFLFFRNQIKLAAKPFEFKHMPKPFEFKHMLKSLEFEHMPKPFEFEHMPKPWCTLIIVWSQNMIILLCSFRGATIWMFGNSESKYYRWKIYSPFAMEMTENVSGLLRRFFSFFKKISRILIISKKKNEIDLYTHG